MNKLGLAIFLTIGSMECSKEDFQPQGPEPIVIQAQMPKDDPVTMTRTSMSGATASFVAGDKIGVSETLTQRSNVPYTASGGGSSMTWTTPAATAMQWFNTTATHTFYAYYPYNASNNGNIVSIPILANQTFGSTPDANADMLVAGPKTQARNTGGNAVAFTGATPFSHAFCLLKFTISTSLLSTYTLKSMTIRGGNTNVSPDKPYGMFNTVNAVSLVGYDLVARSLSVTAANNTAANFAQSLTKPIASTGLLGSIPITVYVFVLPGLYTGSGLLNPSVQVQVSSLLGGNQQTAVMPLNVTNFRPGYMYSFSIQIGNGLIDIL